MTLRIDGGGNLFPDKNSGTKSTNLDKKAQNIDVGSLLNKFKSTSNDGTPKMIDTKILNLGGFDEACRSGFSLTT